MNKDRFGADRCDGYDMEDFVLCELCVPNGNVKMANPNASCYRCGGYGEYPKACKGSPNPKGFNKINLLLLTRKAVAVLRSRHKM